MMLLTARRGSITRAGDRYLRQMLAVRAMAVIRYAQRSSGLPDREEQPLVEQFVAHVTLKLSTYPVCIGQPGAI